MFHSRFLWVVVLVGGLPLVACSRTIRQPQFYHPGPAPYQQQNAQQFDPYPQDDMGPEIVGGRPPGFDKPRNEVERARQFSNSVPGQTIPVISQPAPLFAPSAPVFKPSPPVYTQPVIPVGPPVTTRY